MAALKQESLDLNHCVDTYAPAVANLKCVILALNVCGHRSTVEMSRCGTHVHQHRAYNNQPPHALCEKALRVLRKKWGVIPKWKEVTLKLNGTDVRAIRDVEVVAPFETADAEELMTYFGQIDQPMGVEG